MATPVPPSAVTSSAVSSIVSGRLYAERAARVLRPVQTTVAPASPSATAMPRPAPRVAPATTATRPRSAAGSGDHITPPSIRVGRPPQPGDGEAVGERVGRGEVLGETEGDGDTLGDGLAD